MQPLRRAAVGPEALDHHVDREPVQPGPERRVAAEGPELLPDAHEDVLRQLVGVAAAGHAADEAVHARQVQLVQLLEGADVARRGLLHTVRRRRSPWRVPGFLALGPQQ